MGKCARRVKRIGKTVARALTPVGVKLIADMVGIVQQTEWHSAQKRRAALDLSQAALRSRGIEARESLVRLAIETSVAALKEGEEALAELGEAEAEDLEDDE